MAHFCELDEDNKVLRTLVFSNDDINNHGGDLSLQAEQWVATTKNLTAEQSPTNKPGIKWKQTSYNGTFRKNYGGVGYYYDESRDAFILINKPFNSWILNENTCLWEAPTPYPDGALNDEYVWNEDTTSWELE